MQSKGQTFEFLGRTWTTDDVHYPHYPAYSDAGDSLVITCEESPKINGRPIPDVYEEEFTFLIEAITNNPGALSFVQAALYGPNNPKPDPLAHLDRVNSHRVRDLIDLVNSSRAMNAAEFVENLTYVVNAYNAGRQPYMMLREATARKILEQVSRVLEQDEHASLQDLLEALEDLRDELSDAEDEEFAD
jgi:hypothetical protein